MKTKAIAAVSLSFMMVLLSAGITAVAAESSTKYSVVVGYAPQKPYQSYILVAASDATGEWRGGGSGVFVGGSGKAFDPFPHPSDIQAILEFKVVDGGPLGTDFFLEAEVTARVDHVPPSFFPFQLEWITRLRLTFDFLEGRNTQDVFIWLYIDPWVTWIPLGSRTLKTVITPIG